MARVRLPRRLLAGPLLVGIVFLATACIRTANPEGWASPSLDGSTVFYLAAKDRVSASSLAPDGQPAATAESWHFPDKSRADQKEIKVDAVYSEPVFDGQALYFASYNGQVFALNGDGTLRWRFKDVQGSVLAGPILVGEALVFGSTEGRLYALRKADGVPVAGWPKDGLKFDKGIWAPPVALGGTVYVATMGGEVAAVSAGDASLRWQRSFKADGAIAELQLLDDGHLFAASLNHHVYIVDPASGRRLLDFEASDWVWAGAAFRDGVAYFGDFAGKVYALDITTGTTKWQPYETHQRVKSAPAIVDDVLVLVDRAPTVHFIDLKTGNRLNSVSLKDVIQGDAGTVRADVLPYAAALQGRQTLTTLATKPDHALVSTTKGKLFIANPAKRTVEAVQIGGVSK